MPEVAIITGGTRGIGSAVAAALARRGVSLVINGRKRDAEVEAVLSDLAKITPTIFVEGDAADPMIAQRLAESAREKFGRIDYVVPAAGGPNPGKVTDIGAEQWMEAFRVHVHAVFHLFRACHPLLAAKGEACC